MLIHTLPVATFIQRVETFTVALPGTININVVLGATVPASIQLSYAFDGQPQGPLTTYDVVNGQVTITGTVAALLP